MDKDRVLAVMDAEIAWLANTDNAITQYRMSQARTAVAEVYARVERLEKLAERGRIAVCDLAKELGVKSGDVIKFLFRCGVFVTLTQEIDSETAAIVRGYFMAQTEMRPILERAEADLAALRARVEAAPVAEVRSVRHAIGVSVYLSADPSSIFHIAGQRVRLLVESGDE